MGAWESNGYGKVVDPFWDNKEKSSGGGGSDIPDFPAQRGYFLKTVRDDNNDIVLEWEKFTDNVKEVVNPIFENSDYYVGKVLTRYGIGVNDYGWVNAQAAYTDYSNTSSGLNATDVQSAIDELASSGGGSTVVFDGEVEVDSNSTGTGWLEIPVADRVELFDNNVLKYSTMHVEISFKRQVTNRRVSTQSFSGDIDLKKLLVDDAQDYTDSDRENNQSFLDFIYRASENMRFNFTLNFNEYLTDPSNDVYTGRLQGLFFENRTLADNTYTAFAVEQKIRVKITVK